MKEWIDRLPLDIVFQIIGYTYKLQNKDLLHDIRNYTEAKTLLLHIYYNYWFIHEHSSAPAHKEWLINDIFAYANNYHATMFGYTDKFYSIFRRNPYLQDEKQIDDYVCDLEKKDTSTQINVFLGLLTPAERMDIMTSFPL